MTVITTWLMVVLFIFPAQQASTCDLMALSGQLSTASVALASSDQATALQTLADLQTAISQARAECSGLTFEGEGSDVVLGPFTFADGFYKGVFSAGSWASAVITQVSGDCGFGGLIQVDKQEGGTSEGLLEFKSCIAFVEIKTTTPWKLSFELVAPSS